jgi:hypothetical protein
VRALASAPAAASPPAGAVAVRGAWQVEARPLPGLLGAPDPADLLPEREEDADKPRAVVAPLDAEALSPFLPQEPLLPPLSGEGGGRPIGA